MTSKTEHHELPDSPFRIGDWLVEPRLNRLSRGDESIQIELKMMDVLVCLAESAGELVTRREITDTVWATEFITDGTLTRVIVELRRVLADDAKDPRYIETIHRKGYRLIAPVEVVERPLSTITPFPMRSPESVDDRSPYPGLAAFTEEDAEYFFGREAEVAQLWRKITNRRLLAMIGPSGVGKSSFLRAGLVPATPDDWGVVVCQPGDNPLAGLARALLPEFEGDREAVEKLVGVHDAETAAIVVARWRRLHGRALLIVDQFEELFTQNPPEVQEDFAALLRRLVDNGDVQVLISLRDDFLYRCHDYEALVPVFSELTPIKVPARNDLRRALKEPAARQGFSFEDGKLVDEMLDAVEGERGALPMLAFAVARLWEKRDREPKLLTRQAYSEVGGVAGALAHHAEATLERIGANRLPIVREVFRNLVTADGTRAVREWHELLSIFSDSRSESQPEEVLRQLIDARLLTSYEIREEEQDPARRVEIIHESLLGNWPRLVGWQTQDADSVRMREGLRQAARTWEEHDRSSDYLWSGKAFREYSVWRENYPGGLTELEENFASAMVAHAKGRKRRRRIAVAAAFLILLAVLGVVGVSRQHALSESRRAEASKLEALGQLELEDNPSGAVAFATASLEQADTRSARTLALSALWRGPTALVANSRPSSRARFSPDGSWLLQSGLGVGGDRDLHGIFMDGSSEVLEQSSKVISSLRFPNARLLCTYNFANRPAPNRVVLWSTDDRRQLAEVTYEKPVLLPVLGASRTRLLVLVVEDGVASVDTLGIDGTHMRLGTPGLDADIVWRRHAAIDPVSGRWLGVGVGDEVMVIEIGDTGLSEPRSLGTIDGAIEYVVFDPLGRFLATADSSGGITLWDVAGDLPPTSLRGPPGLSSLFFSPEGSLLAARAWAPTRLHGSGRAQRDLDDNRGQTWVWALDAGEPRLLRRFDSFLRTLDPAGRHAAMDGRDGEVRLWSFEGPAVVEAMELRRGEVTDVWGVDFHPDGGWIASADQTGIVLWPLARPYPAVIRAHEDAVNSVVFEPQGRWLASGSQDGTLKIWPLDSDSEVRVFGYLLGEVPGGHFRGMAVSPDGGRLMVASDSPGGIRMMSLVTPGHSEPLVLPGFPRDAIDVAFSPDGRLAAGTTLGFGDPDERVVRVWDVETLQEVNVLGEGQPNIGHSLAFAADGSLLSATETGLRRWDVKTGDSRELYEGRVFNFSTCARSGRVILVDTPSGGSTTTGGSAVLLSLNDGTAHRFESHGNLVSSVAMDAAGELVVTGSTDGTIRVGRVTGGEPHLLLGHEGRAKTLAVDPKGRWIASGGMDGTVRFWPIPDLDATPLHTLPRDELIAKLKTLTNLRAVRDEESASGWTIEVGPFPGWETVPSW